MGKTDDDISSSSKARKQVIPQSDQGVLWSLFGLGVGFAGTPE